MSNLRTTDEVDRFPKTAVHEAVSLSRTSKTIKMTLYDSFLFMNISVSPLYLRTRVCLIISAAPARTSLNTIAEECGRESMEEHFYDLEVRALPETCLQIAK